MGSSGKSPHLCVSGVSCLKVAKNAPAVVPWWVSVDRDDKVLESRGEELVIAQNEGVDQDFLTQLYYKKLVLGRAPVEHVVILALVQNSCDVGCILACLDNTGSTGGRGMVKTIFGILGVFRFNP